MKKNLILSILIITSLMMISGVCAVDYDSELILENKNPSWEIISEDGIQATLQYNSVGQEFEYSLSAGGLSSEREYSLIYYADKVDRFVDWGGNNPGALIVTATSNSNGNLVVEGSIDLGMSLPSGEDANIDYYDYCEGGNTPDEYDTCHGAKIWLVPTDAIGNYPELNPDVTGWDKPFWASDVQPYILFETDLITYTVSGPEMGEVSNNPLNPKPEQQVDIFSEFSDSSGIDSVQIRYQFWYIDGSGFDPFPIYQDMILDEGDIFNGIWKYHITPSPNEDGYAKIRFYANDIFGNEEYYPSYSGWLGDVITYDGTSPETTISVGGGDYITSQTLITLVAIDPDLDDEGNYEPSGIDYKKYKINDGTWETGTSFQITGDDGTHAISYYSVDNAGNVETEKSQSVVLDNTKPETTDDSNLYVDWQANGVTVTLTPTDSGSGVASTKYCVGDINCDPITDGTSVLVTCADDSVCEQYVRYFSTDNVGNVEDVQTSNVVRIDKEKSMTTLTIGSPKYNDEYITSSTEITLTCDDGTGSECDKIYYQINDGGFLEYSVPLTISGDDGNYILQYYSVDKVGNIETTNEKTLILDNTEPTTTDNSNLYVDWQAEDVTVILTPSDNLGSGVASTMYCVDTDGTCIPNILGISVSVTCALDSVCEQYVNYQSTDNVGNVEDVKTSSIINIDKTGPVTTVELPIQVSWFSTDFVMLFSDTDVGVGTLGTCHYTINEGTLQTRNCGEMVTITVGEEEDCSTEGEDTCRIKAYAEDSLGNIGNIVEVSYNIDWTWPTEIVSSSPSGEVTEDNTILEIETNKWATCKYDTQSKSYEDMANHMTSSADGINHEAGLTGLEDGMYVYYVRCQDNAGNKMRTSETIVFTVDTSGNYNLVIDLNSGWDFFFLPRIILETITSLNGNYSVQNVLASIEGSYIGIMYHYDEEEGWRSYVPDRVTNTGWPLNDLTEFDDETNSPYWIQMIESDRLELA